MYIKSLPIINPSIYTNRYYIFGFYSYMFLYICVFFTDASNSSIARFLKRVDDSKSNVIPRSTPYKLIVNKRINKTFQKYEHCETSPISLIKPLSDTDLYLENIFMHHNMQLTLEFLSDDLKQCFESCVLTDCLKSLSIHNKTLAQNNFYWKQERRLRITASQCYSLFTYTKNKNPDWEKKISSYINPKQFKSASTEYGKNKEKVALDVYETQTGNLISNMGLIFNPSASWLACSPDGVDLKRNVLIEIKCPVLGATKNINDLLPELKYLKFENNSYHLKKNHNYYGQVQLAMFILNIQSCDFIIFSEFEKKCKIVKVIKDVIFLSKLVPALKFIYEKFILSYLEKNVNKEN